MQTGAVTRPREGRSPFGALSAVLVTAAFVLVVATVQMAAESAGWLDRGARATSGFAGHSLAVGASVAALLAAAVAAAGLAVSMRGRGSRAQRAIGTIVAPLAAVAAVMRSLTYDPYYLPTERRFIDVHPSLSRWLTALAIGSIIAAMTHRIRPRAGYALGAAVTLLAAVTVLLVSIGH